MSTALPAPHVATLLAGLPGAFLAHGVDAAGDVDAAFDDAVDAAGYDHGFAGLTPSVAGVDADAVTVAATTPLTLARATLEAVRALHAGDVEPGRAYALPICPDSTHRRRRVRLVLTDPALELAETAGPIAHVSSALEAQLRAAAAAQGVAVADQEQLEALELTSARPRYKPAVTVFRGATASSYALLDPARATLVGTGYRTAGEARRAAVALVRSGPVAGSPTGALEVLKVTGRADGPLVRVGRSRVATRLVARLALATVKDPAKVRTTGWLFYGTLAAPAADPTGPEAAATA